MTSALGFNPIVGGVEVQVDGTAVATFKTAGSGFAIPAAVASGDAVQKAQLDAVVFASCVFSVLAGTLTIHKSVGLSSFTRRSAGTFDFTFSTTQDDAYWTCAVNHVKSTTQFDTDNQVVGRTTTAGALTLLEAAVPCDPASGATNASSITFFK